MTNLRWGSATDAGMLRATNEDCALAERPIFAVADGMGGRASGEVASSIAVGVLRRLCGPATTDVASVLEAVTAANDAIVSAAVDEHAGMGTTLTGIALVDDRGQEQWLAFNVGDSRVYRLYSGRLEQLTKDHTEAEELVAAGALTPDQRRGHPSSRRLTRVLGIGPAPAVDSVLFYPTPGERLLLCSDGVHGELDDQAIRFCLEEPGPAAEVAQRVVRAALAAAGRDNLTAVVVDVVDANVDDDTGSRGGEPGR